MVLCIYSIQVFNEAFHPPRNLLQLKKCFYPVSMATIVRKINSFITIKQLINTKYPWRNGVKQIKTIREKLLQRCIFWLVTKGPDLSKGDKMQQKLFILDFYYHFLYTWVNLICLTCLIFLKFLWWSVWTFCAHDLYNPAETDVFRTSSGRLKKIMTSYD